MPEIIVKGIDPIICLVQQPEFFLQTALHAIEYGGYSLSQDLPEYNMPM